MKGVTHILFDVDGVLIDGWHANPKYRKPWTTTMEADIGLNAAAFEEAFFQTEFLSVAEGKQQLLPAIQRALSQLGSTLEPQAFVDYWHQKDSVLNQPVLELVRTLYARQSHHLAIATQQADARATYLWEDLAFKHCFHECLHTARFNALKDDPTYFQRVTTHLQTAPETIMLVDDNPHVVATAKASGWQTFHLSEPGKITKLQQLLLTP